MLNVAAEKEVQCSKVAKTLVGVVEIASATHVEVQTEAGSGGRMWRRGEGEEGKARANK